MLLSPLRAPGGDFGSDAIELVKWLDDHTGSVGALLTFALVVVTAANILMTNKIARETHALGLATRRLVEDSALPVIVFRLAPGWDFPGPTPDPAEAIFNFNFKLILENVGRGPALDLRTSFLIGDQRADLMSVVVAPRPFSLGPGVVLELPAKLVQSPEVLGEIRRLAPHGQAGAIRADYRDVYSRLLSTVGELDFVGPPDPDKSRQVRVGRTTFEHSLA